MSLLDHPEAQALLDDAILSPDTVRSCADRLTDFLQRYLPKFYRVEQRENAATVIRGLLSGLERKTCEPIATEAGLPRKPIQFFVGALTVRVRAKQDGRIGPEERLVVIRRVGESRIDSALSNAGPEVPLTELVCSQRQRHRIEECFAAGNGEAGLDHSEVRSWVGWHHHVTLSLLALWFLCLEQRQLGGETPALTVSQLWQVFSRLLRNPAPTAAAIAVEVTRVLRRNEEARIYHWYAATRTYPPRRARPDTSEQAHFR